MAKVLPAPAETRGDLRVIDLDPEVARRQSGVSVAESADAGAAVKGGADAPGARPSQSPRPSPPSRERSNTADGQPAAAHLNDDQFLSLRQLHEDGKISDAAYEQGLAAIGMTATNAAEAEALLQGGGREGRGAKPEGKGAKTSSLPGSLGLRRLRGRLFEGVSGQEKGRLLPEEGLPVQDILERTSTDDKYEALRFLRAYRGVDDAARALSRAHAWRRDTMAAMLDNPAPLVKWLARGHTQLLPYGTKDGHPIVVIDMLEDVEKAEDREIHALASLYVIEKAIACCDDPMAAIDIIVDRTQLNRRAATSPGVRARTAAMYDAWHAYYPMRIRRLHIYPPGAVLAFSEHKVAQASAKGTWERSHASAAQLCKLVGKRNLPKRFGGAMAHEFNVSDVLLPKLKVRSYYGSQVQLRFADSDMQERFEQWAGETSSAHRWRNVVMTALMVVCTVIVTGMVRHGLVGCENPAGYAIFGASYTLLWAWFLRWASRRLFEGDVSSAARRAAMLILFLCGSLPLGRALSVPSTNLSHPLCRPMPPDLSTFSQGDPVVLTAFLDHLGLASANVALTVVVEQVTELLVFLLYMQLLSAMNLPFDVFARWIPVALLLWALPSFVIMSRGENPRWVFQAIELLFALAFTSMQMKDAAEARERFKASERAEQVLALAQEEASGLRSQTENTPMVTVDASLNVSVWNDAMENLTGWRAQDVIGRPLVDKLVETSSRRAVKSKLEDILKGGDARASKDQNRSIEIPVLLRHAAASLTPTGQEGRALAKAGDGGAVDADGGAYTVSQVADGGTTNAYDGGHAGSDTVMLLCTTALRADASGTVYGIGLLAQDITERVRMEEARKTFVASFSHELRTPLTGIMGMLELLSAEALSSDAQRYVDKARVSSNLLLNLINDILDMSRIEAGKMQLGSRPFKLQRTVEGTLDLVRYQASMKKLALKLVIDDDVPAYVRGDVLRFRQVILNLLSNAVKFTTRGTITVLVRNDDAQDDDAQDDDNASRLRISVRDTGIGIPEAQQNGLFHMFSKLDQGLDQAVANASGCGLGLAICARLVALMKGVIEAQSTEGKGSTFTFTCKLGAVSESEAKSESSKSAVTSDRGSTTGTGTASGEGDEASAALRMRPKDTARTVRGRRVLLAEDNAFNAEIIVSFLNAVNVQVTWTSNGSHALELFTKAPPDEPYDVVLMDCQMPIMNGWDATKAIRAWEQDRADANPDRPRVPVIALTAYAMDEEQKKCLSSGMDVVITKPVTRQRLVDVIAHLVADSSSGGSDSASSHSAGALQATNEIQKRADTVESAEAMTASLSASLNVAEMHSPATRRRLLGGARVELSASLSGSGSDRSRKSAQGERSHKAQVGSVSIEQALHERQQSLSREYLLPAHVTTNGNTAAMLGNASPNTHLLPIDEDLGMAQFGNRQMYMRMMSKFAVNYLPAGVRAITTANKDGDIIALRMEAHSLKGSAAFVGAMALADVCSRLMAACGIEGGMSQWQQKFVDAACQQVKAEFDMLNAYFESKHKFTLMDGDGADDGAAFASQMLEFEGDKGDAEMAEHLRNCRGRKVLVVEDDPFTAEVLQALVQGAGMSATHCGDGKAGVAMYISDPSAYDIVVMDCIMPGQSGSKSAQTIRAWEQKQTSPRYRRVPIVGLSAYRQHEKGCKEAGMDTFVVKPIGRKSLLRLIARLVKDQPRLMIADASARKVNRICKVDTDLGLDQYDSSENYRKVLRQFVLSEATERYDAIYKAAQGEHWGLLHLAAHSLKGSSGMVYATGMNEVCLQLHRACTSEGSLVKDASAEEVLRLVADLGRECEMLRDYCGVAPRPSSGTSDDSRSTGSSTAEDAASAASLASASSASAFAPGAAEASPAQSNAAQTLVTLEKGLFGHAQTGAMLMRVVALENAMLGSAQTGAVKARISALKVAILG